MHRIEIQSTNPYTSKDFEGTEKSRNVLIFDDIDNIPNPQVKKIVAQLRDQTLTESRHHFIDVVTISHDVLGGQKTKASIQNSNYFVVFPQSGVEQIRKFLRTYMGLNELNLDRLLNPDNETRWIMLSKQHPQFALTEHSVFLL